MLTAPLEKGVFLLFLNGQASTGRLACQLALIWSRRTRVFRLLICFVTMNRPSAAAPRRIANLRVIFLKGSSPNG